MINPFFAIIFIWSFLYVATLLLYWQGWNRSRARLGKSESESESGVGRGVSVIVPFRNEEKNLPACIASLKALDYPNDLLEIIFVNDHSTDSSAEFARSSGAVLLQLEQNELGKKAALSKGIKSAKFENILTLDADSTVGSQWLKEMMNTKISGDYLMVGALVKYHREPGFFNAFLNIEMCSLMGLTAGAIQRKKPLMANGTNLLFSKEAFNAVGAYENDTYASGDDVFLMHKVASKFGAKKIGFNSNNNALVSTEPVHSWKELFQQRLRWAGKAKAYPSYAKRITLLMGSINILMAFLLTVCFFQMHLIPFVVAMFVLKGAADVIITLPVMLRTNQGFLLKFLVPVALVYPFYITFISIYSLFFKARWKGRGI